MSYLRFRIECLCDPCDHIDLVFVGEKCMVDFPLCALCKRKPKEMSPTLEDHWCSSHIVNPRSMRFEVSMIAEDPFVLCAKLRFDGNKMSSVWCWIYVGLRRKEKDEHQKNNNKWTLMECPFSGTLCSVCGFVFHCLLTPILKYCLFLQAWPYNIYFVIYFTFQFNYYYILNYCVSSI